MAEDRHTQRRYRGRSAEAIPLCSSMPRFLLKDTQRPPYQIPETL